MLSTLRPIEADDEITINYTGDPDGRDDLWFEGPGAPRAETSGITLIWVV